MSGCAMLDIWHNQARAQFLVMHFANWYSKGVLPWVVRLYSYMCMHLVCMRYLNTNVCEMLASMSAPVETHWRLSIQIIFGEPNKWSWVWRARVGRYLEICIKYGHVSYIIFGVKWDRPDCMNTGITRLSRHREEKEICFSLSMD